MSDAPIPDPGNVVFDYSPRGIRGWFLRWMNFDPVERLSSFLGRFKRAVDAYMTDKEQKGEEKPWHLLMVSFILGTIIG